MREQFPVPKADTRAEKNMHSYLTDKELEVVVMLYGLPSFTW